MDILDICSHRLIQPGGVITAYYLLRTMLYITLSVCCSVAFRQFGLICYARLVCHTIHCRAFTAVVIIEPPIIFLLKELGENLKK